MMAVAVQKETKAKLLERHLAALLDALDKMYGNTSLSANVQAARSAARQVVPRQRDPLDRTRD